MSLLEVESYAATRIYRSCRCLRTAAFCVRFQRKSGTQGLPKLRFEPL